MNMEEVIMFIDVEIKKKTFTPKENHHNLYDNLFEYADFYIDNPEDAIIRYGKTYKLVLIDRAKLQGYNIFYLYLSNGVRMAKLKRAYL
jgi:hypothetical protein